MIGNIRRAFIEMLQESTWMDDVSRSRAIEKVPWNSTIDGEVDVALGSSHRREDWLSGLLGRRRYHRIGTRICWCRRSINEHWSRLLLLFSLQYVFNSSYIRNVLKVLQIKAKEQFQLLRKPINRKSWGSSPPTIVNAFYTPSKNQISALLSVVAYPVLFSSI